MTQEELKQMLNLIVSKCDNLINNNLYTADDFTQCNVEDIAEMCNMALDGKFGELPSLPSDIDEAAFNYAELCKYEGGDKLLCVEHFKAGSKWVTGQGGTVTDAYVVELNEDKGLHWLQIPGSQLCDALKNFNIGDKVIVQIRKK